MPLQYHLQLDEERIQGATLAILPGDPDRVPVIAERLTGKATFLARHREYQSYLVEKPTGNLLVVSTGIGGPSTSIALEELAKLGVKNFLRVGTTGALQPEIAVGDLVITSGAVRLDGASTHYAPIEYPAVADFSLTRHLVDAAVASKIPHHIGITASSDTFYPGQERYDTFTGYVIRRFQNSAEEWRKLGVLNYEMEGATLLTIASAFRLRAACVCGVVVNRSKTEHVQHDVVAQIEQRLATVAEQFAETVLLKR